MTPLWSMTMIGSSPLARGLRLRAHAQPARRRIIPARAGFTAPAAARTADSTDHPRSRGVYPKRTTSPSCTSGSSPLARGLRPQQGRRRGPARIIPARAGFTTSCRTPSPPSRDHPRSRGVYTTVRTTGTRSRGSSPLARGLRERKHRHASVRRIIPARAGFTGLAVSHAGGLTDHPRSRGVYSSPASQARRRAGSSPLARGLPRHLRRFPTHSWIIPARAGFTPRPRRSTIRSWDHPRSRGVYLGRLFHTPNPSGSSPLARGLPSMIVTTDDRVGIIPARAGFTFQPSVKS